MRECLGGLLSILILGGLGGPPAERPRAREFGIKVGVLEPGPLNAVTDVAGVRVGHLTLIEGTDIRTGVTAVLPHGGDLFMDKVPAAVAVANGFGKLTGISQVRELGTLETPVVLTNTLSVPTAAAALIEYTLAGPGHDGIQSVNPVVGETNDGALNDIRARRLTIEHVLAAIRSAREGPVAEGAVGAGTGTMCFGWKGGIGTSSRRLSPSAGGWTVGVLAQTNFGGVLRIAGIPVGEKLGPPRGRPNAPAVPEPPADGSCLIVVATDAPLDARNLERLAKRALLGIARAGGTNANGSGDYAVAFSTAKEVRVPHQAAGPVQSLVLLRNEAVSPLFQAAAEASEEAILDSLFKAERTVGRNGRTAEALPLDRLKEILAVR